MSERLLGVLGVAVMAAALGCSEDKASETTPKKSSQDKAVKDNTADKPPPISHKPFDIDRVDASRYVLDDEALSQLLVDGIAGQIHVSRVNRGYRLDGYADDTLIAKLGLAKGDVIVTINDAVLTGPRAARVAFAKARQDGTLRLAIDRTGNSIQRRYYLRRLLPGQGSRSYRRSYRSRYSSSKASHSFEKVLLAMRTGIKQVSESHIQIDREIMVALEKHDKLLKDGLGYVGLDLGYAVEDEYSVYKELKLTKYDLITQLNGVDVGSRSKLRRTLASQAIAKEYTLTVKRLGEPLTIRYEIVDNRVDKKALAEAVDKWSTETDSSYDPLSRYSRKLPSTLGGTPLTSLKKLDDTTFQVSRAELKQVWTTMYASRGARIVPAMSGGKTTGIKLYAIRPTSPWAQLGFKNGDTIHTLNSLILDSMIKMMDIPKVFTPTMPSLLVVITRRGKTLSLTYQLK